jgi:hypothetical protein
MDDFILDFIQQVKDYDRAQSLPAKAGTVQFSRSNEVKHGVHVPSLSSLTPPRPLALENQKLAPVNVNTDSMANTEVTSKLRTDGTQRETSLSSKQPPSPPTENLGNTPQGKKRKSSTVEITHNSKKRVNFAETMMKVTIYS